MKKVICVSFFAALLTYTSIASEAVQSFVKAAKTTKFFQYSINFKINDESKETLEIIGKCAFAMEPSDTAIGAYYNLESKESKFIYSGSEFLEYYPEIWGEKIVNLFTRENQPDAFTEQVFEMNGQKLVAPSQLKSSLLYSYSVVELMNDLIELDSLKHLISLPDTIINGYDTRRVKFIIKDTIIDKERYLFYYSVAFDKKSNFPVYYLKYSTSQQNEVYFSDYDFNPAGKDILFTRKAFPADYKFVEKPEQIVKAEEKELDTNTIAPDWTLSTINDKEIKCKDLKGSVILLEFSEIGCAPCTIAIPDINKIAAKYKDLNVISVYPLDKKEALKKYVVKKKIEYNICCNAKDVSKSYHVSGYPSFFLIDDKGIIKFVQIGYGDGTRKEIEKEIEKLLKGR